MVSDSFQKEHSIYKFSLLNQSQATKLQPKLEQAVKRLAILEEQLDGLKTGKVSLKYNHLKF